MKTQTILTTAALLAAGALVGAAASQPSQAQQNGQYGGGEWQSAGSYHTTAGGEVWMINTRTGAARNCFWAEPYERAPQNELRCRQVD